MDSRAEEKKKGESMTMHTIREGESQEDPAGPTRLVTAYTVTGKEDYVDGGGYPVVEIANDMLPLAEIEERTDAYAARVIVGTTTKHYIKKGKHGRLFNPIGLYSEGQAKKRMNHAAKMEWTLQSVTPKTFKFYLDFLRTKNEAYLNNAEREI